MGDACHSGVVVGPAVDRPRQLEEVRLPEQFGTKPEAPLHAARIEDYALIGDLESAALVSRDGSIDWLCWPSFSSPACFAALLGTAGNGYWRIKPQGELQTCHRAYRGNTLILETTFESEQGEVQLTDYMPLRGKQSDVVRTVRGIRGSVDMRLELVLRFDYGLTIPWVTVSNHELRAIAGANLVVLRSRCAHGDPVPLRGENLTTVAEFTVAPGDEVCFVLTYGASTDDLPPAIDIDAAFRDTESFWTDWAAKCTYQGPYGDAVRRSLLTLEGAHLPPHRWHRRRTHGWPAGGDRRRAQLGLPLLLAARCVLHPARARHLRVHR